MPAKKWDESLIHGVVEPGFEEVREEFVRNFRERGEIGAACAVYHRGKKVVDLWGGYRDYRRRLPWEEDTLAPVFSVTKGVCGMALAIAHSRVGAGNEDRVSRILPGILRKRAHTPRRSPAQEHGSIYTG